MAELKTKKNEASVDDFLNFIENEQKRKDCFEIAKMMQKATKQKPKNVGTSHRWLWRISLCICERT